MKELVIRIRLADPIERRPSRAQRYLDAERIGIARVQDVARAVGIPKDLIAGGGRSPNGRVLFARRLVAYTLRVHERLSFPEIARALGLRDHTSALHLFRTAQKEYAGNASFEIVDVGEAA